MPKPLPIIELPVVRPEPLREICPYCDQPLDGPIMCGLHVACSEQYNRDIAEWEGTHPTVIEE